MLEKKSRFLQRNYPSAARCAPPGRKRPSLSVKSHPRVWFFVIANKESETTRPAKVTFALSWTGRFHTKIGTKVMQQRSFQGRTQGRHCLTTDYLELLKCHEFSKVSFTVYKWVCWNSKFTSWWFACPFWLMTVSTQIL